MSCHVMSVMDTEGQDWGREGVQEPRKERDIECKTKSETEAKEGIKAVIINIIEVEWWRSEKFEKCREIDG